MGTKPREFRLRRMRLTLCAANPTKLAALLRHVSIELAAGRLTPVFSGSTWCGDYHGGMQDQEAGAERTGHEPTRAMPREAPEPA